jgi:hypothetical protein
MLDLETKDAAAQALKEAVEKLQQVRGDVSGQSPDLDGVLSVAISWVRRAQIMTKKLETT